MHAKCAACVCVSAYSIAISATPIQVIAMVTSQTLIMAGGLYDHYQRNTFQIKLETIYLSRRPSLEPLTRNAFPSHPLVAELTPGK